MINSKEDLMYYLEEDKKALGIKAKKPWRFGADIWKFQIALRHIEYYTNVHCGLLTKFCKKYWFLRFYHYSMKLGFDIPVNVFGPGLNIHHWGCVVVNAWARVGKNCNLQQGVTIGMNVGGNASATIGDNVFLGSGAKIIGEVHIANGCIIGANAVVTKDFLEENSIIAGVPAKVIGYRK